MKKFLGLFGTISAFAGTIPSMITPTFCEAHQKLENETSEEANMLTDFTENRNEASFTALLNSIKSFMMPTVNKDFAEKKHMPYFFTLKKANNTANVSTAIGTNSLGESKINYYGFYSELYLDHDVVSKIEENINFASGISTVISILSGAIIEGPAGFAVGAYASLIVAQWKIWKIHEYDYGKGVVIKTYNPLFLPTWIVWVSPQ